MRPRRWRGAADLGRAGGHARGRAGGEAHARWRRCGGAAAARGRARGRGALARARAPDRRADARRGRTPLRIEARGGGVAASALAFETRPGERFLGFGERSDAVVRTRRRGRELRRPTGPYRATEDARGAFVPPPASAPRDDATYFPVPWLLSSRGFGVLRRERRDAPPSAWPSGAWSVEVDGRVLDLRVFAGPRPADALRRFTARTAASRRRRAMACSARGWQAAGDEARALRPGRRRAAGAPVSLVQTYTHYLPCGDAASGRASASARAPRAARRRACRHDLLQPDGLPSYTPALRRGGAPGALPRTAAGAPYLYRYARLDAVHGRPVRLHARRPARVFYDAARPKRSPTATTAGWRTSASTRRSTRAPPTARPARPTTTSTRRSTTARRATRRRRAARPSSASTARAGRAPRRCAQIVWGGDPTVDWGFDGLARRSARGCRMGLSGVGLLGLGHRRLLRARRADAHAASCSARWIELGAVSGVMRTQANGFGRPRGERPQPLDPDDAADLARARRSCARSSIPTSPRRRPSTDARGLPLMRHLVLTHPGDRALTARDDQYLFGADLLVAPVLEPGATSAGCGCRAGAWVDLWRSALARPRPCDEPAAVGGGRRAACVRGPRTVTLAGPARPSRRCSPGPARCCRCCRPTSCRSPRHADRPGRPRRSRGARRTSAGCSPSRAGLVGSARARRHGHGALARGRRGLDARAALAHRAARDRRGQARFAAPPVPALCASAARRARAAAPGACARRSSSGAAAPRCAPCEPAEPWKPRTASSPRSRCPSRCRSSWPASASRSRRRTSSAWSWCPRAWPSGWATCC